MQKLLIQNKLPPSIINDPNILDGKSSSEIILEVKKGQELFKQKSIGSEQIHRATTDDDDRSKNIKTGL